MLAIIIIQKHIPYIFTYKPTIFGLIFESKALGDATQPESTHHSASELSVSDADCVWAINYTKRGRVCGGRVLNKHTQTAAAA